MTIEELQRMIDKMSGYMAGQTTVQEVETIMAQAEDRRTDGTVDKVRDQAADLPVSMPDQLLQIGESYLKGDVLKDPVAAGAWLELVLEQGEIPQAVKAMELLAREVWKKEKVLSEEDYEAICKEVKSLVESQRFPKDKVAYLLALKALGDSERSP